MAISYTVSGIKSVIAQDGPMTCWATVYTMMISWKRGFMMPIRDSVKQVNNRYALIYDAGLPTNSKPKGLPAAEFGPFLTAANMQCEPMINLMIEAWADLLKEYGLLWIGTLNSLGPNAGLHSRIIEGINGGGAPDDTFFSIIDPDGGRQYAERFDTFLAKYEGAITGVSGQYFQIRHF